MSFSNVQTVCLCMLPTSYYSFYFNYFSSQKRDITIMLFFFLELSPKFIFSPDNCITFYIIQNRKTHWERSTQSWFKNAHNTIEFNISKEQTSASLKFGNHDSGLNCGLYLRLTKGHCWEMKVKSKSFARNYPPPLNNICPFM